MTTISALLACLLLFTAPALGQSRQEPPPPPITSPDGTWEIVGSVELPERYPAPKAFTALRLDEGRLKALLAGAPRETFGAFPKGAAFSFPLADGSFATVDVATTEVMEAGLAAKYPGIRAYVFEDRALAGRLAVGPGGMHFVAQTVTGRTRVEPVETAAGRVYVAYLNRDRTDGGEDLSEPGDRGGHDHEPPPPAIASFGAGLPPGLGAMDVSSGPNLRIYRLAASTTGEFFQARDAGNGAADVLASLIVDLNDANTVFEPEVGVRLILADASEDVLYADPDADPFDPPNQCVVSGNACSTNADCDTDTDESCGPPACTLRDENRDNFKSVLDDADYDLGFLFATKSGGGANGCAWFVVCLTTDDTLHKARGAGRMGGNGTNGAGGLLSHEVGHMLGARHTFTGTRGSCTQNEFTAGDSQSGYEPGSGTTRMSYRGLCDDDTTDTDPEDNVDTSVVDPGSYFHSRSFDEIVGNVLSGDGSTCGTLVNTGNAPPGVQAGADYTIPRQTPFMLVGGGSDDEAVSFTWEQFDRADTRRPINTDPGDGPLVRSVPGGPDPSRTIPHLPDLLAGITRNGEILPQVDRELNFRLIGRDNRMGGGGVAYDTMTITVAGSPFFITSPNSGFLQGGCQAPLTWEVGGGSVAPSVNALFSSDGGLNFDTTIAASIANDGDYAMTVPCGLGSQGRIKLESVGNIFFDINDQDLVVYNNAPDVEVTTAGGSVDETCEFTVQFNATASDSCGLNPANVQVELIKGAENFTLGTPTMNVEAVSANEVSVSGSVLVSDLTSSPAQLSVRVTGTDACGAATVDVAQAIVIDDTPPTIDVSLDPTMLWAPNHMLAPVTATVVAADNCPGVSFVLTSITNSEPDNGLGDGDTAADIQGAVFGTADTNFLLRSERAGSGPGRAYTVLFTATDGSGNSTPEAAVVQVPKNQ